MRLEIMIDTRLDMYTELLSESLELQNILELLTSLSVPIGNPTHSRESRSEINVLFGFDISKTPHVGENSQQLHADFDPLGSNLASQFSAGSQWLQKRHFCTGSLVEPHFGTGTTQTAAGSTSSSTTQGGQNSGALAKCTEIIAACTQTVK